MKKRFLLLAAVATHFAHTAQAQLHKHSNSFVGVKIGGSAASFNGDAAKNLRYVTGFNAGVFANFALLNPFSLQTELLYSMKGMKDAASFTDNVTRLNYVDLPVLLRASTLDGLFAEAGPQLGYLINAKSDASGENIDVKAAYRTIDFGYVLGVGYQPPKGGLGGGARYNAGFLSVFKTDEATGLDPVDLRNSGFQVYVSYSPSTIHKPRKRPVK